MFEFVLIILSLSANDPPEVVATFKTRAGCEAVAKLANTAFASMGESNKAICNTALEHGEI